MGYLYLPVYIAIQTTTLVHSGSPGSQSISRRLARAVQQHIVLNHLGIPGFEWLSDPGSILYAGMDLNLVIYSVWNSVPTGSNANIW